MVDSKSIELEAGVVNSESIEPEAGVVDSGESIDPQSGVVDSESIRSGNVPVQLIHPRPATPSARDLHSLLRQCI